jgi:hypothetical protein
MLNPVVGIVHVAEDGSAFGGDDSEGPGVVYDETVVKKQHESGLTERGTRADLPTAQHVTGRDIHKQQVQSHHQEQS